VAAADPAPPAANPTPAARQQLVATTELYARATLPTAALVLGSSSRVAEPCLDFAPIPRLWDEKGVRMALKDVRHPAAPVAQASVSLAVTHVVS
jgi:hypothetical protein